MSNQVPTVTESGSVACAMTPMTVVAPSGWTTRPVHLLSDLEDSGGPHRWAPAGLTRRLHAPVLSPSGRSLLAVTTAQRPDGQPDDVDTLAFIDIATGHVVDLGYARQSGARFWLDYAATTDDRTVAVAAIGGTRGDRSVALRVLSGPGLRTTVVERVFPGCLLTGRGTDYSLQWSPDGHRIALTMREPGETYNSTQVLDAATLETELRLRNTWLMGSLSWSTEGDELAVAEHDEPRILHLADRRLDPVHWLPGRRRDPPRGRGIAGLLSGGRALTVQQTVRRARIAVADLATGEGRDVAAFRLGDENWPAEIVLSRAWEHLPATAATR